MDAADLVREGERALGGLQSGAELVEIHVRVGHVVERPGLAEMIAPLPMHGERPPVGLQSDGRLSRRALDTGHAVEHVRLEAPIVGLLGDAERLIEAVERLHVVAQEVAGPSDGLVEGARHRRHRL